MRVLWLSNPPWAGSGYGMQTGVTCKMLRDLGHDVAIQAFWGLEATTLDWDGIPVYPAGRNKHAYGMDVADYYVRKHRADLLITLTDAWVFDWDLVNQLPCKVAHWMPVDQMPLGVPNHNLISHSKGVPIAMSTFGYKEIKISGALRKTHVGPFMIPHSIDTALYAPPVDKPDHFGGKFVIGINAANQDPYRKGWFEQLAAFARFHNRHPDSVLLCHTVADGRPHGLVLDRICRTLGIGDAVIFPEPGDITSGYMSPQDMVEYFYHSIDLLSNCAYAEGFGLAVLEAQSCGVPVVITDHSSMHEVGAPAEHGAYRVPGAPFWNPLHQALWGRPDIAMIEAHYNAAYDEWKNDHGHWQLRQQAARTHALKYDSKKVRDNYWRPLLPVIGRLDETDKPVSSVLPDYKPGATYVIRDGKLVEAHVKDGKLVEQAEK